MQPNLPVSPKSLSDWARRTIPTLRVYGNDLELLTDTEPVTIVFAVDYNELSTYAFPFASLNESRSHKHGKKLGRPQFGRALIRQIASEQASCSALFYGMRQTHYPLMLLGPHLREFKIAPARMLEATKDNIPSYDVLLRLLEQTVPNFRELMREWRDWRHASVVSASLDKRNSEIMTIVMNNAPALFYLLTGMFTNGPRVLRELVRLKKVKLPDGAETMARRVSGDFDEWTQLKKVLSYEQMSSLSIDIATWRKEFDKKRYPPEWGASNRRDAMVLATIEAMNKELNPLRYVVLLVSSARALGDVVQDMPDERGFIRIVCKRTGRTIRMPLVRHMDVFGVLARYKLVAPELRVRRDLVRANLAVLESAIENWVKLSAKRARMKGRGAKLSQPEIVATLHTAQQIRERLTGAYLLGAGGEMSAAFAGQSYRDPLEDKSWLEAINTLRTILTDRTTYDGFVTSQIQALEVALVGNLTRLVVEVELPERVRALEQVPSSAGAFRRLLFRLRFRSNEVKGPLKKLRAILAKQMTDKNKEECGRIMRELAATCVKMGGAEFEGTAAISQSSIEGILIWLSLLCALGDFERAIEAAARILAADVEYSRDEVKLVRIYGLIYRSRGSAHLIRDCEEAIRLCGLSRPVPEETDDLRLWHYAVLAAAVARRDTETWVGGFSLDSVLRILRRIDDFLRVRTIAEKYDRDFPAFVLNNIAIIQGRHGDLDEAIESFRKIGLRPSQMTASMYDTWAFLCNKKAEQESELRSKVRWLKRSLRAYGKAQERWPDREAEELIARGLTMAGARLSELTVRNRRRVEVGAAEKSRKVVDKP